MRRKTGLSTIVEILQRVQRLAASESSSIHEIVDIVASDAVLASNVLRMVNSAFFGVERKIMGIEEAVVLLGFSHLKDLFAGIMMASATQGVGNPDFDRAALWRHSLGTAVAADSIKAFTKPGNVRTDLHLAGLLCNIGRLVLDQRFPNEFGKAVAMAKRNRIRLIDAESTVFGVNHAEVGFWAAEFWNFDPQIAHLIKWHHGPAESHEVDVVNLAYVITQAKLVGDPGDRILTRLLPGVMKRLELDVEKMDELLNKLVDSYESLNWIFKYVPA